MVLYAVARGMQCGLTYEEVLDTPWRYVRAFLAADATTK